MQYSGLTRSFFYELEWTFFKYLLDFIECIENCIIEDLLRFKQCISEESIKMSMDILQYFNALLSIFIYEFILHQILLIEGIAI